MGDLVSPDQAPSVLIANRVLWTQGGKVGGGNIHGDRSPIRDVPAFSALLVFLRLCVRWDEVPLFCHPIAARTISLR
ncbi:MAG: hypothetical protein WCK39_05100 [Methanomassiliicoccales archaeon]